MYFEIKDNQIKRIHNSNQTEYINPQICYFKFKSKEWAHKEKYIIFWIEKDNTIVKNIGKKCWAQVDIPTEKSFTIQIYVNDNLKTEKYTVGETAEEKEQQTIKPSTMGLIHRIYQEFNTKIDNVLYIDNVLKFYANDELIKAIDLVDTQLIKKVLKEGSVEINVDNKLSTTSKNPVQNKTITRELDKKQDSSTLPKVAITGDYNDLENIPTEFEPKHHNHVVVDVVDYEENIDFDLGRLLDSLYDEITKE